MIIIIIQHLVQSFLAEIIMTIIINNDITVIIITTEQDLHIHC